MASSTLFFELQVGLEQLVGASGTQDFETWASVIRDKLADQNNCAEDFYSVSNIIVEMTDGLRLPELAYLLSEQIHFLLNCDPNHCDINSLVRSCVQVLKLTGKSLEKDLEPTVVQSIFDGLNLCIYNSTILDESVKDQIWNLDELRRRSWSEIVPPGKQDVLAEPIVEGMADGGRDSVNDDECAFLEKITDEICGSATESWNETFEQDQVHNDYEKFLEATAVQIAEKALENISLEDGRGDLQNSSSVAPASDAPMS
uniref:Uncharacterized protein n=1 Tax=Ditylenchus dipsaci TaxID=166011 RepID=A0A915E948_9BILA